MEPPRIDPETTDLASLQKDIESLSLNSKQQTSGITENCSVVTHQHHPTPTQFTKGPNGTVSDPSSADRHMGPIPQIRMRVSRSPRRTEDEHYVYSVSQTGQLGRLRNRRRSDPGGITVSPMRGRFRMESDISEDMDDDSLSKQHPRLQALRSGSEEPTEADLDPLLLGRSRSRSPHFPGRARSSRSLSLPGMEFEIGEAIGALALKPLSISGLVPAPTPTTTSTLTVESAQTASGQLRRRRSVSVECCSPLEAIIEENPALKTVQSSRRFSTPAVNSATAASALS